MKNEKKSLEDLKNSDPEGYMDKVKRVDDDRIQVILLMLDKKFSNSLSLV